jgi:hypothetical protein
VSSWYAYGVDYEFTLLLLLLFWRWILKMVP